MPQPRPAYRGGADAAAAAGLTDVAIVAERASVYGVARMVAVIVSHLGVSMRAFRRLDEARAWLDAEEAVNRS